MAATAYKPSIWRVIDSEPEQTMQFSNLSFNFWLKDLVKIQTTSKNYVGKTYYHVLFRPIFLQKSIKRLNWKRRLYMFVFWNWYIEGNCIFNISLLENLISMTDLYLYFQESLYCKLFEMLWKLHFAFLKSVFGNYFDRYNK